MNLEIWCRLFLDGESHEDVADALTEGAAIGNSVRVPSVPVST
jgi:hypothetical protein